MKKLMSKVIATALAAAMVVPMISTEAFAYDRQEAAVVSGGTVVSVYSGTQNSNDQGNYLDDPGDYVKVNTFKTSGAIESTSNITSTTNFVQNILGGVMAAVRGGNEGVTWDGNTLTLDNASGTVITIEGPTINPYEVNTYNDKLNPNISDGAGSSDLSWAESLTYFKQYDLFSFGGNAGAPHTKDNSTTKDTVYINLVGDNNFNNIAISGNVNVVFIGTGSLTLDASQTWDYDDYNDPDFDHMSDCTTEALATVTSSGYHGQLSGEVEKVPMENARFKETVTEWYEYDLPEISFANGMYIAEGGEYYDEAVVGATEEAYNIYQSYVGTEEGPASKVVIKCRDLFTDVAGSNIKGEDNYQYYFNAVYWGVDNGITKGYSDNTFRPQNECTRAEMMIFLWRMAGCPTEDADGNAYGEAKDYFNDITAKAGSDTSKAIAWGYKAGITKGYSDGSFGCKKSVSRIDAMIFLYRLAGKPDVDTSAEMKFSDVTAKNYKKTSDSYRSVLWGSTLGITNGYSSGQYKGQFGVDLPCLREAIITFLYRFNQKVDIREVESLIKTDNQTSIYDESYAQYFDEDGVDGLVKSGNVYLNGVQIPATAEAFNLNGVHAVWQLESGNWTWQSHDSLNKDTTGLGVEDYYEAVKNFINGATQLRGMTTELLSKDGTTACELRMEIQNAAIFEKADYENGVYTVWGAPTSGTDAYVLEHGPNDVYSIEVAEANYDTTIEENDTILYWMAEDGWHVKRAVPVVGTIKDGSTTDALTVVTADGEVGPMSDALVLRYNMYPGSRPRQVLNELKYFGISDIPVTVWCTDTGYAIGLSHMENAREALARSLEYIETYFADKKYVASDDGEGVEVGTYYASQSVIDTWEAAYAAGKAAAVDENLTDARIDKAIEVMSSAFGGRRGLTGVWTLKEAEPEEISADAAVEQVSTIGFVDLDGAKISTVVVEYNVDLTGAELTTDMFTVDSYGSDLGNERCALGSDPGKPLKVYVNDQPEASEEGGSGTGKYVIIELNTDYQLSSVTGGAGAYNVVMDASVLQTGTIVTDNYKITPATEAVKNWEEVQGTRYGSPVTYKYAIEGQYEIQGLDVFELHTKDDSTGYEAYHATNCFDEATGEYSDVDLPYALYVPDDYDPSKQYGLVLHIHDASAMGDNPVITLTESKAPINYASEEVQQMAKDQGLAGLIVVCPQFNDSIRTARDNWSLSCGVSATWQLLDYLTSTYNIDMNRIYASGQSMGGMQVMAMAQQRDNYFAAIWPIASQWGTNYNLSTEYQGSVYYETPADGTIVWKTDCDGNEVNYRNMYYMLSDDNILVLNCADDMLSSYLWKEYYLLYKDLVNVEIPKGYWNPLTLTADEQDAELEKLLAQDNETGIYWAVMDGGSHGDSWVYAHKIMGCYKWLLSQTRETENARAKLDLNKQFELADEQNETDEYLMISKEADGDNAGFTIYYKTGKAGSGTLGYNSTLYGRGGQTIEALPGWDPFDTTTYGLGYYVFSFD